MQITILQAILLGLFCFLVSTGIPARLAEHEYHEQAADPLSDHRHDHGGHEKRDDHRLRYSGGLYRSDVDRRGRDLAQNQYRALVCFAADVGFGR